MGLEDRTCTKNKLWLSRRKSTSSPMPSRGTTLCFDSRSLRLPCRRGYHRVRNAAPSPKGMRIMHTLQLRSLDLLCSLNSRTHGFRSEGRPSQTQNDLPMMDTERVTLGGSYIRFSDVRRRWNHSGEYHFHIYLIYPLSVTTAMSLNNFICLLIQKEILPHTTSPLTTLACIPSISYHVKKLNHSLYLCVTLYRNGHCQYLIPTIPP